MNNPMYLKNKCCSECRFWRPTYTNWKDRLSGEDFHDDAHGDCHRFPPVFVSETEYDGEIPCQFQHPLTWYDDWCGEFASNAIVSRERDHATEN